METGNKGGMTRKGIFFLLILKIVSVLYEEKHFIVAFTLEQFHWLKILLKYI
jgi:hypothetical protein